MIVCGTSYPVPTTLLYNINTVRYLLLIDGLSIALWMVWPSTNLLVATTQFSIVGSSQPFFNDGPVFIKISQTRLIVEAKQPTKVHWIVAIVTSVPTKQANYQPIMSAAIWKDLDGHREVMDWRCIDGRKDM